MKTAHFYEDGSRLLTPGAVDFVLDCELKRALRAQTFLTLVTVEARRQWDGLTVAADDGAVSDLAHVVSREVRDTDLLSQTDRGMLWLVLLDADIHGSRQVIERVLAQIDDHQFPTPLSVALGAACCPTDAVDAESLQREALSRPMVSARRPPYGTGPFTDPT